MSMDYEDIRCTDVVTCCEECPRCGDDCDGIWENMKNPKENFNWEHMTEKDFEILTDKEELPRYTHGESYGEVVCGDVMVNFVRAEEGEGASIHRIDLFLADEGVSSDGKCQLGHCIDFPLVRPNPVYNTFEEFKDAFENALIEYASGAKQFGYNRDLRIGSLIDHMKCEPETWMKWLKVEEAVDLEELLKEEPASMQKKEEETENTQIFLPLTTGDLLCVEKNPNPEFGSEFIIGICDKNKNWIQNITLVRENNQKIEVLSYKDPYDDDNYTDSYTVDIYHGAP